MADVPIGVLTRDRVACLDVTLKSLSATDLPEGVRLRVFVDRGSDHELTRRYLSGRGKVPCRMEWPQSPEWRRAGLLCVNRATPPEGLAGRVPWEALGKRPLGVIEASRRAILRLRDLQPEAPAVILLQDDVVFNRDWYARLLETAEAVRSREAQPLGVLAGIKLNTKYEIPEEERPRYIASGITAQCLYITRAAIDKVRGFFDREWAVGPRFDDHLCRLSRGAGFWVGCTLPFVCQHFGVWSLVRPFRTWRFRPEGRIGHYATPPYVVADTVRDFR